MNILVINCGSSSLKYSLFTFKNTEETRIAFGVVERIGLSQSIYKRTILKICKQEKKSFIKIKDHTAAIKLVIEDLLNKNNRLVKHKNDISIVGHRVVHGGNIFTKPVLVTKSIKTKLKKCFELAPLHNPAHYAGIIAVEKMLPSVPSVLVFDTAFHYTIPDFAYMYAIPYKYYKNDHIRKYGFHGTSHCYVAQEAALMLNKQISTIKLITVHLGNGSSVTAIKNGRVIDTSMGFTPLHGVVMGTRCGTIDTSIIPYLIKKYKISNDYLNTLLNKKSGLYGISGYSDIRNILSMDKCGNKRAKLAINMLCYSVKKYICAYYGILNGIDGLVFTAGIGEHSSYVRENICSDLDCLGIKVNVKKNKQINKINRFISNKNAKVKIMVIPTNEELMIAKEAKKFVD
ncbi:MAG: acetate kinase [Endomicrobium sp.]|jgi:acetate kinase|nr:acetate kinase [Endomicrobium sp.]